MIKKKVLTALLALSLVVCTSASAFAQNCYYDGYYQPCQKTTGQKVEKALKYGALGAGAGYVLSGKHNRGTNMLKGAAIGTAASFFTK